MYIRNVPKEIRDLLRSVAADHGVDYRLVEDIYYHQFEYVADQMAKGDRESYDTYSNVMLRNLGSWIANEKHLNKIKEIENAKKDRNDKNGVRRDMGSDICCGEGDCSCRGKGVCDKDDNNVYSD